MAGGGGGQGECFRRTGGRVVCWQCLPAGSLGDGQVLIPWWMLHHGIRLRLWTGSWPRGLELASSWRTAVWGCPEQHGETLVST